jgi:hypothetical protein
MFGKTCGGVGTKRAFEHQQANVRRKIGFSYWSLQLNFNYK